MDWRVQIEDQAASAWPWPARVSVPSPRGTAPGAFSLRRPDGSVVAAQSRTLVRWPDGSPRWTQLDFEATSPGEYVVSAVRATAGPRVPIRCRADEDGRTVRVSVGRLSILITPASPSPIAAITWDDRALTNGECPLCFTAFREDGSECPITGRVVRDFTVEASGPNRYQASWETEHADAQGRLLDVRFRVECLAGIEGFALSYHFLHRLPGCERLCVRNIDASFFLGEMQSEPGRAVVVQTSHGTLGVRRFVRTRNTVPVILDRSRMNPYIADLECVDDTEVYPYFLEGVSAMVGSAVALEDDRVALVCTMCEFECRRPKTITVRPGEARFGIWPESAGPLSLPQGRSCRQTFAFRFLSPDGDQVDSLLASGSRCAQRPAQAWLAPEDSAAAGPTWEQPLLLDPNAAGAGVFGNLLTSATNRWLTVAEMFNYGDTVDKGYRRTYAPLGRTPPEQEAPPEFVMHPARGAHPAFHPGSTMAPVWSNNEYDVIYCLALEALRTHDPSVLEKLTSAARHQIEVDFVHYSDHWQHHRATPPHSYDHVVRTAALASHQWTQGLYYYYALTGDDDVPEVVRGICDFDIAYLNRDDLAEPYSFNREPGWGLLALVYGYELTAEPGYIAAAKDIAKRLVAVAGKTDFEAIEKRSSSSVGLNASGIGGGFNVNTCPLGVMAYHKATGERWAWDVLKEWVDYGLTNFNNRSTGVLLSELFVETLCYVCERNGDSAPLRDSRWQLVLFLRGFNSLGWLPVGNASIDDSLDTKAYARIYRALSPLLPAMARAGLLEGMAKWLEGEQERP